MAGVLDTGRRPAGNCRLRGGGLACAELVVVQGRQPAIEHIAATEPVRQRLSVVSLGLTRRQRHLRLCRLKSTRRPWIVASQRHRRLFVWSLHRCKHTFTSADGGRYTVLTGVYLPENNITLSGFLPRDAVLARDMLWPSVPATSQCSIKTIASRRTLH